MPCCRVIIWLNGAFGAGKTSVARLLVRRCVASLVGPAFAEHIDAEGRDMEEIAQDVLRSVTRASAAGARGR
jgi:hypothetical protein